MPEVFYRLNGESVSKVRIDYFDLGCDLFKERFGIDYSQYPLKPVGIREVNRIIWHTQLSSHNGGDFFNEVLDSVWSDMILLLMLPLAACLFLRWFLSTRIGLSIRATGDNPGMVRASSVDTSFTTRIGLMLSGALTALSGAMIGQYQKTIDINSGTGVVVIGLACLIIGETVLGARSISKGIAGAVLGSVIYRFLYAFVFYTQLVPVQCLKLLTAAIVAAAIAAPTVKMKREAKRRLAEAEEDRGNA